MYKRDDVIGLLKPFLVNNPKVLCVWEAGSAATNTLDKYSDLDIMIVAKKRDIESLFQAIDDFLDNHFEIRESMRLKEPTWHGFAQKFYDLKRTESWFYIDLCLLPPTTKEPFTSPDRHGRGLIWKDSINFVHHEVTPREETLSRAKDYYQNATEGMFVTRLEIDKALRRNQYLDAYHFMYSFVMRALVPLMNIEHRMVKVDFGIRYANRDYHKDDYALLLSFFSTSNLETLKTVSKEIFSRYETLKKKHAALL